jgi:glycine dehydrogenase
MRPLKKLSTGGTPKAQAIAKIGKLFLDFGLHSPTVAFPEQYGLMIEPTESFTKDELDRFVDVVEAIHYLINEVPQVLSTSPHFCPVSKVDEVQANKNPVLWEPLVALPKLEENVISPATLAKMDVKTICDRITQAHEKAKN